MTALVQAFGAHIEARRLFPRGGVALVAVSGGPDSVALLDLLARSAPQWGLELVAAHADHGIQPDSGSVADQVRALGRHVAVRVEVGVLGLGAGTSETVARRARYAWLREVQHARGARYLVTAHHRDDQIETILLRVLRGSAPAGLAGMPARARGGLIRPLLPFGRAELAAYVRHRGLAAHDDPANADPAHLRSWVRGSLIPMLTARLGERVADDVRRVGRHAARDRRAWDRVLEVLPELDLRVHARGFDVARGSLAGYHNTLSVALLRAAGRRAGVRVGPVRAARVLALASGASGRRVPLGSGWVAEAAFDRLRVVPAVPGDVARVVPAAARGEAVFGDFRVRWAPEPAPPRHTRAGWTIWVPGGGWELRGVEEGDRLRPLGGVGRRAVRRLLMEARVPRGDRARYPVLVRGDAVLWVPGICRAAAELPPPGTPSVRVDVTDSRAVHADGRAPVGRRRV